MDVIDPAGALLVREASHLPATEGDQPSARFREIALGRLENGWMLYSLHRADAIRHCLPLHRYATADVAVLAEMALLGPFVYVPQPIHKIRDHLERYSRKIYYNREAIAQPGVPSARPVLACISGCTY